MIDLEPIVYQLEFDEYNGICVTLDLTRGMNGAVRWAIREGRACLNKKGEWEHEPMPSSRTDAFFNRCRWNSAEAAIKFWRDGQHTSRLRRSK